MPSQEDVSQKEDAVSLTKEILRGSGERDELYLINRLDQVVGGLIVLARNKSFAKRLSDILSSDSFSKRYYAIADGTLESGVMVDWMAKDSAISKAIIKDNEDGAKKAELEYSLVQSLEYKGKVKSLFNIKLKTGRFHQIRAQFAHRGAPLTGDKKYGSRDFLTRQPALFAYNVSIDLGNEKINVTKLPDLDKYPWNLFSAEKYSVKCEE
jgi:23S rRNA pseudouridine1911/1915/1917 synthase